MEKYLEQIEEIFEDFDCGKIGGDAAMEQIGDILNLHSQHVDADLEEEL